MANARASLYEGATYFVTPGAHVDADAYQLLYGFLGDIGARPVAVDPEEHDRLMAVVSHLPHVLANVLMSQAGQHAGARDALLSAGPSFRDLTRIAGSNRRVWTDIFLDNRAALLAALAQFQEGLQEVLEALAADDAQRLGDTIARAAEQRERMLAAGSLPARGPVPPHHPRPGPARRVQRDHGRARRRRHQRRGPRHAPHERRARRHAHRVRPRRRGLQRAAHVLGGARLRGQHRAEACE